MKKNSIFRKFEAFFKRGNVIDLAVGVIIGDAFSGVIKSIVDDIIMPPIGMIVGKIAFSDLKWVLSPATESRSEVA
ncbi:MAG TPA: large conductance mechanosensitive channel protein MscL, partial [Clostridium sp.]|nr:large conductance mechanosensitive channel protein MscL [Clostridium sp.]